MHVTHLTKHIRRRVEINETLVDTHLVKVPCLGSFTVWRLTGVDSERLGRQTNWTLDINLLVLGPLDQVTADCKVMDHMSSVHGRSFIPHPLLTA